MCFMERRRFQVNEVLLDVENLSKNFESNRITVKAVSDLSFKIYKGGNLRTCR